MGSRQGAQPRAYPPGEYQDLPTNCRICRCHLLPPLHTYTYTHTHTLSQHNGWVGLRNRLPLQRSESGPTVPALETQEQTHAETRPHIPCSKGQAGQAENRNCFQRDKGKFRECYFRVREGATRVGVWFRGVK